MLSLSLVNCWSDYWSLDHKYIYNVFVLRKLLSYVLYAISSTDSQLQISLVWLDSFHPCVNIIHYILLMFMSLIATYMFSQCVSLVILRFYFIFLWKNIEWEKHTVCRLFCSKMLVCFVNYKTQLFLIHDFFYWEIICYFVWHYMCL